MKKTLLLIIILGVVAFAIIFLVSYINNNTAYNNSKASTLDINPNFKYFGIIGSDSYINGWTPPLTHVDENISLVDQNLQNIMIMVFNPSIGDPSAFSTYFDNYAQQARNKKVKLIVDTFLLTANQDNSTWGTADWEARNKWRLDLYNKNKDVIYAFSTDEPANHLNEAGFRDGYIRLTKKLRELFPDVGVLAVEFRPYVTDNYDVDFHKYVTDIGFDAYDNYWGNQTKWLSDMERNVPEDKKLWLIPQGYIAASSQFTYNGKLIQPGVMQTGNAAKQVMSDHINYAKEHSRYVGILPFNWSITMNGHNEQAVACMKEMMDPNSQYYTEGYKELIQQTVAELKAKSGSQANTTQKTATPTSRATTIPTSTTTTTANVSGPSKEDPVNSSIYPLIINYSQGTKVAIKEFNCDTRKITVTVCDNSNYDGKVLTRAWIVDQNNNRNFIYAKTGQDEIDSTYEKTLCNGTTGHSYEYMVPNDIQLGKLQIVAWDITSSGSVDFNKNEFPSQTPSCETANKPNTPINIVTTSLSSSSSQTTTTTSVLTTSKPSSSSSSSSKTTTQNTQTPVAPISGKSFPMNINLGNGSKALITKFDCNTKEISGIVCDSSYYDRKVLSRMWLVNSSGRRDYFWVSWVNSEGNSDTEKSFCNNTTGHSFSTTIPSNLTFDKLQDQIQLVTWDITDNGMTDFSKSLFPDKTVKCE